MSRIPKGFQQVVYAADLQECDCCGEPWCAIHLEHYADCECIGPHEDEAEVEYRTIDDVLYARRTDQ